MTHRLRSTLTLVLFWGISLCPPTLPASSAETLESIKESAALAPYARERLDRVPLPQGGAVAPAHFTTFTVGDARIFFIDVGQGDASYIELPNGQNVLIDAGPSNAKISAFLKGRGVTKLDHVVLTHPHADHYKGFNYVFDKLQVRAFYDTRIDNTGAKGDDVVRDKAAKEPGCSTYYPVIGSELNWGEGVTAKVFNSCSDPRSSSGEMDGGRELNNCSIVIKLVSKGKAVLLTGDAQSKVERAMIESFGDELSADILKVGHHGSAESTMSAFLSAVNPSIAVISVGTNGYGFPTSETLTRLADAGVVVYRTDLNGTLGPLMFPEVAFMMEIPSP